MTRFSYTIETLIHAGQSGMTVTSVPVRTNSATRPSRLFKSIGQFLGRQAVTMLRSCVMYRYMTIVIAFLSDTIATNRRLAEEALLRLRRLEAERQIPAPEPQELPQPSTNIAAE